jgi:hypothetical protein
MDCKKLVCFLLVASATSMSHADGVFINAGLGENNFYPQPQPQYLYPSFKGHGYTEAMRVGYRWNLGAFSYGLETGYANLGHSYFYTAHNTGFDKYSERIDGPMLGANLKYALPFGFFVSGRGGFFRSTDHQVDHGEYWIIGRPLGPYYYNTVRENPSGMGSYVGVGLGYDFNASFGVGLNYDRYRAHVVTNDEETLFGVTPRVDAYTLSAEYRF